MNSTSAIETWALQRNGQDPNVKVRRRQYRTRAGTAPYRLVIEIWSSTQLQETLDKLGVPYTNHFGEEPLSHSSITILFRHSTSPIE